MKQIEIFKTSICNTPQAVAVINGLLEYYPHYQINVDLDDCDQILRIETQFNDIEENEIEQLIIGQGYICCHLPG